jgi:SAM-dependent methyltransferase
MAHNNSLVRSRQGFIESCLYYLKATPFHPQWLIFRDNYSSLSGTTECLKGRIIDIGCGNKEIKKYLAQDSDYIGLDFYKTAVEWYGSRPDIYGDAQILPLRNGCADTVILLDVLEHLPNPEKCIYEISRILVRGGTFLIQVPFVYPLHDAPLDFHRWTLYGLREILSKHNFKIIREEHQGNPVDSASLLMNIAICKMTINWIKERNPAGIIIILIPFIIFFNNIFAKIMGMISKPDPMMPWGYRLLLVKDQ